MSKSPYTMCRPTINTVNRETPHRPVRVAQDPADVMRKENGAQIQEPQSINNTDVWKYWKASYA